MGGYFLEFEKKHCNEFFGGANKFIAPAVT